MPFTSHRSNKFSPCRCVLRDDEEAVQPGLALTPAEIGLMSERGIPISPVNAMGFFDGYRTLDFTPGILSRRGVDLVDVWNVQMDSRKKLVEVSKASQQKGGD